MKNQLASKAVLMRLSIGSPGTQRADRATSEKVKASEHLGQNSGKWVKELYPPDAMAGIRKLDGEAQRYHSAVTLPFDTGCGILPAGLIIEYGDRMRQFKSKRGLLIAEFIAQHPSFIEWAQREHNGTFDASLYDAEKAKAAFYFRTEPIPVPDSCHFESTVTSLLGVDAEGVDQRVRDASVEAQRELLRRMIEPVAHMARTLAKDSPKIFDTLTGNLSEMAELVPKLNLAGDAELDAIAKEMADLAKYKREDLKKDMFKSEARKQAEAVLKKLEGYRL
jgi:hypothetical protein